MPWENPARGDIYHLKFEAPVGPHFAIVITNDAINAHSSSMVVAIITSQNIDRIYPHQFKVPEGLLKKPSKVKGDGLMMLPKETLTKENYIATIHKRDLQGLDLALMNALDLWR